MRLPRTHLSAWMRCITATLTALAAVAALGGCEQPQAPQAQRPTVSARSPEAPAEHVTPVEVPHVGLKVMPDSPPSNTGGSGAGFHVHEWGLIQFSLMGSELATSGYDHQIPAKIIEPLRPPHPPMKKPLIYFHPESGFNPSTAITVTLKVPAGGRVREVWPTPGNGPQPSHFDSYTWPSVRIIPNTACGAELAPKALTDAPCASLTAGVCESHEMNEYLRPVPHCLDVSGQRAPVLLYNGTMPADVPPLKLDAAAGTLKNNLGQAVGPVLVRWKDKVIEVASLAPGEQVTLSDTSGDLSASVTKRLSVILTDKGLTDAEALSFMEAWKPDVLKEPYAWTALGVLSPEGADAMLPLTIFPKPRSVTRVLAFTVE
jgi:hypothetical protein